MSTPPDADATAAGGMGSADGKGGATPRRRLWAWVLAASLLLLLALPPLAGLWLWHDTAAQARLLQRVPGLQLEGLQGRLGGGAFAVQKLQWRGSGWTVTVSDLAWDDARWRWRPQPGAWLGLELMQARAARVQVLGPTVDAGTTVPAAPPGPLQLPLTLSAKGLRVASLEVDQQPAITGLRADLELGAAGGGEHRVSGLVFSREGLDFRGEAVFGGSETLALQARLGVATAPSAQPAWQAELKAQGPLQRLDLQASLNLATGGTATAEATLAPYAEWPLLALAAQFEALDLSALQPGWPQTGLSGLARLVEPGSVPARAGELSLELDLENSVPGPWDAARVPLKSLQVLLRGSPSQPNSLVFERLIAEVAGTRAAGRLSGSGQWQDSRLTLNLQLDGLLPEQLHTAMPPMHLGGRLALVLNGVAVPGSLPAAGGGAGLQAELKAELQGRLPARGAPLLDLSADAALELPPDGSLNLDLRELRASAGGGRSGRASAQAQASRSAVGDWRLRSEGRLQRFDPAPWWPAAAVARGPQQLNGDWSFDLALPAGPISDGLRALRGQARLTLDNSRWAGLDWTGSAELQATPNALQLQSQLQAGPNHLQAGGSLDRAAQPALAATIDLQAPELALLAPLGKLLPGAAEWWPQRGSLQAQASIEGRWPALSSQGRLQAQGLRSATLSLQQADVRWTLSNQGPQAPLSLQLDATELATTQPGGPRLEQLQARLEGTLREHRLQLTARSPLRPPVWAEPGAGSPAAGGSNLVLQGAGRWAAAAAGGGQWQGRLDRLQVHPRATAQQPWLDAAGIEGEFSLEAGGALRSASLAPGRVELFDGALSWQQASWQAASRPGAAPEMALSARLEPLQVAPLLARLQPQFGWFGDLVVGGRMQLRSGERFDADVVIERSAGDLGLTIEGATRRLEISDLRLGLAAHDGLWQFTQALVGRSVGVVGGLQTINTSAQALWPEDRAPLSGGLSLIVPQLAVWAPWLPPGWRLGGELRIGASFGGTVGAPEYRGEVSGEGLAVRHLFEGIRLQQGTLAVTLDGTQATIDRLEFRDATGDGLLRVSGGAAFGEQPVVQLRLLAEKLRLLDRFDRRITLSGTADMDLRAERLGMNGNFTIDEGLVDATQADAPSSDSDVVVINRAPLQARPSGSAVPAALPGAATPTAPRPGALDRTDVDLRINLGQALRLRGRGLDTLLRGQLRITTPGGQIAVNGVVRAEEGTYRAYGQNLRIERGRVIFRGNPADPTLDILALRADIDTQVGVVVTGTATLPRVRLYSGEDLGDMDTLTWLVLGRAPDGLGRDDTALLQRVALALLSGQGDGGSGLLQRLGLDELTLSRGGTGDASDTVVSVGKQLSRRLYVGYEHALGTAGGTLQLIYRVAGRLTLRARTGHENALDAIWTWRWD